MLSIYWHSLIIFFFVYFHVVICTVTHIAFHLWKTRVKFHVIFYCFSYNQHVQSYIFWVGKGFMELLYPFVCLSHNPEMTSVFKKLVGWSCHLGPIIPYLLAIWHLYPYFHLYFIMFEPLYHVNIWQQQICLF